MARNGRNKGSKILFDLIHEDYALTKETTRGGITTLKCASATSQQCQMRAVMKGDTITIKRPHANHSPDPKLIAKDRILTELHKSCIYRLLNLTSIYSTFQLLHEDIIKDMNNAKLRESMRIWRRKQNLPSPKGSYRRLMNILQEPKYNNLLSWSEGKIDIFHLQEANSQILSFFDEKIMKSVKENVEYLVLTVVRSAEIKLLPVEEIIIVSAVVHEHAFPVMHLLIKKKTVQSYDLATQAIGNVFQNLQYVYANFDRILHESLNRRFDPDIQLRGTFYAYSTLIADKAKELGLDMENSENACILRKLLGLAFLPADHIINGFDSCLQMSPEKMAEWRPLLTYYQENWLNSVGPEAISIYDHFERMNNVQIGSRRILMNFLEKSKTPPTIWTLIGIVVNSAEKMNKDLERINTKKRVSSVVFRVNYFNLETSLRRVYKSARRYEEPTIETLQRIGFLLQPFHADLDHFSDVIATEILLINNNVIKKVDLVPTEAPGVVENPQLVLEEINPDYPRGRRSVGQPRNNARQETERHAYSDQEFSSEDEEIENQHKNVAPQQQQQLRTDNPVPNLNVDGQSENPLRNVEPGCQQQLRAVIPGRGTTPESRERPSPSNYNDSNNDLSTDDERREGASISNLDDDEMNNEMSDDMETSDRSQNGSSNEDEGADLCHMCKTETAQAVFNPCNDKVLCYNCISKIGTSHVYCPICKGKVSGITL